MRNKIQKIIKFNRNYCEKNAKLISSRKLYFFWQRFLSNSGVKFFKNLQKYNSNFFVNNFAIKEFYWCDTVVEDISVKFLNRWRFFAVAAVFIIVRG